MLESTLCVLDSQRYSRKHFSLCVTATEHCGNYSPLCLPDFPLCLWAPGTQTSYQHLSLTLSLLIKKESSCFWKISIDLAGIWTEDFLTHNHAPYHLIYSSLLKHVTFMWSTYCGRSAQFASTAYQWYSRLQDKRGCWNA